MDIDLWREENKRCSRRSCRRMDQRMPSEFSIVGDNARAARKRTRKNINLSPFFFTLPPIKHPATTVRKKDRLNCSRQRGPGHPRGGVDVSLRRQGRVDCRKTRITDSQLPLLAIAAKVRQAPFFT